MMVIHASGGISQIELCDSRPGRRNRLRGPRIWCAHGASGEVVFNTALTGYQEVFTDPSYSGQIVVLTNPQIGNYGTSRDDNEAKGPYIEGLAVREFSHIASNWRSDEEANGFLAARHPIVAISIRAPWCAICARAA